MSLRPWMKFYPADWQSDECLRLCSLAARALWAEILCVMHKSKPYGYLLVNGSAPTSEQLAVLAGAPAQDVDHLISELDVAGVFSRNRAGIIFSRRMVKDEKRRIDGEASQKKRKNRENRGVANPVVPEGKIADPPGSVPRVPPPQSPEARKPDKDSAAGAADGPAADLFAAAGMPKPLELKAQVWAMGVAFLVARSGLPDAKARGLVGKWRRDFADIDIVNALAAADAECAVDVVPFVEACLQRSKRDGSEEQAGPGDGAIDLAAARERVAAQSGHYLGNGAAGNAAAVLPADACRH